MTDQVKDFALYHQVIEPIHDLFNTGQVIPEVNIEYVNIACPELLQARFNSIVHAFEVVADIADLLIDIRRTAFEVKRVFSGNYKLVANSPRFRPFANKFFRAFVLANRSRY